MVVLSKGGVYAPWGQNHQARSDFGQLPKFHHGRLGPATQPPRVRAANELDARRASSNYAYMPSGFVYILASKRNGTLYTGVTSRLIERVVMHREGRGSKFVTNTT